MASDASLGSVPMSAGTPTSSSSKLSEVAKSLWGVPSGMYRSVRPARPLPGEAASIASTASEFTPETVSFRWNTPQSRAPFAALVRVRVGPSSVTAQFPRAYEIDGRRLPINPSDGIAFRDSGRTRRRGGQACYARSRAGAPARMAMACVFEKTHGVVDTCLMNLETFMRTESSTKKPAAVWTTVPTRSQGGVTPAPGKRPYRRPAVRTIDIDQGTASGRAYNVYKLENDSYRSPNSS